jgi:pimeloyl-ACP methyl ester carboxylesterase
MTVTITNHNVPHVSRVPANENQLVALFVREFDGRPPSGSGLPEGGPVVLMLHGKSVPSLPAFAPGQNVVTGAWRRYGWAESLARSGLDVFVMDLQGSGLSPRPKMEDPCNAKKEDRTKLGQVAANCDGHYPYAFQLNNSNSDRAELLTVLNWIRDRRNVGKINLVGWSAAAFVLGPFAMAVPEMVDSLFLLAPIFPPWGFSGPPQNMPMPGFPMTIQTKEEFLQLWNAETSRGALREPGIENVVWESIMDNDRVGEIWGAGVMRIRNAVSWGWNKRIVQRSASLGSSVPVAIVYGTQDQQANTIPDLDLFQRPLGSPSPPEHLGPPFNVRWLYRAIPGDRKLMIRIGKTGHFMPWETSHEVLHRYSADWIKQKSVKQGGPVPASGHQPWISQGSYELTSLGLLVPVPA